MMSEDDKKKIDDKPETVTETTDKSSDADTEAVPSQDEVEDTLDHVEEQKAQIDGEFEDLDAKLDAVAPPVIVRKSSFGSLIVAALLGGVATVALIGGVGYYLVMSNNLGGMSKLFNGGDAAAKIEERYLDLSTRVLSFEGELIELQDFDEASGKDVSGLKTALAAAVEQAKTSGKSLADIKATIANAAKTALSADGSVGAIDGTALIALQTEIDALKQNVGGVGGEAIAKVEAQIKAVETELAALKTTVEEVANAETKIGEGEASQMASALAVASLERALQDEKPFEVELNAIKAVAGESEAFAKLSSYAAKGLASEVTLLNQFDGLLEAALVADLKGEGKSILDRFIGNAKSVISIRKTGNVAGDGTEAVLARMEVAINAKDLDAALQTAQDLDGPAKMVFADWIASTDARLDAKDLMRQVSAEILTSLQ